MLALADPAGYMEQHDGDPEPLCDYMLGDLNGDGLLDFGDINPFVEVLRREV